ncbi:MAG: acetate kinase, partial [Actinobacteria bacterium]|nr:acetate kinase [Actinomycetota bacterium]
MHLLIINCGSSSLKFDVMNVDGDGDIVERPARGEVDRIGATPTLHAAAGPSAIDRAVAAADHGEAVKLVLEWLADNEYTAGHGIDAVAHRIVHGGARVVEAAVLDDGVLRAVTDATALAPLHNRPALAALRGSREVLGHGMPMVALFDTAFHTTMPDR